MKKSTVLMISFLIGLFGISSAVRDAMALDAPHNTNDISSPLSCSRCHYSPSTTPTWATQQTGTDNTFKNNLCTDCHISGSPQVHSPKYQEIKTHSAGAMLSTKYWGGNWTVECTTCHNPHTQQQAVAAGPTVDVLTGTVAAISTAVSATQSSLTAQVGGFGNYAGYLLIPNTAYPNRIFRILLNDSTTLTVYGAINPNYTAVGKTFAIRYGKMVPSYVSTPYSGKLPVKFYNQSGPDSFGNGNTTSICQVCHTQTLSYRSDGFANDPGTHNEDTIDQSPGGLCNKCHHHIDGFKPPSLHNCIDCHGNPPASNVTGPGGVVGTGPSNTLYPATGATTSAGAHVRHANTLGMSCKVCHANSVMPTINKQIAMQFQVKNANYSNWYNSVSSEVSSGSITVYSGLTPSYSWLAGPGTTLYLSATDKNYACLVYCHGSTINSGSDKSPNFMGGPSQAACGTCHGASTTSYPATGGHARHVGTAAGQLGLTCDQCHGATAGPNHVNGSVGWSLNVSSSVIGTSAKYGLASSGGTGQLAPSAPAAYQACTQLYCHSSAQSSTGGLPATYATVTWSDPTLNCGSCHTNMNTASGLGSHPQHVNNTDAVSYPCAVCHSGYTPTTVNTAVHVNGTVNTAFTSTSAGAAYTGGTITGDTSPGGGYGSCSATVCHGNGAGAPVWGANTTDASCVKCHGVSNTNAAGYAADKNTAAPGYTLSGRNINGLTGVVSGDVSNNQQVGAHDVHLRALNGYATGAAQTVCNDCHTLYSTATGSAAHMNGGTATMVWSSKSTSGGVFSPTYAGGVCSNVYCHGVRFTDPATRGTNTMPVWTDGTYLAATAAAKDPVACNKCHMSPPVGAAKYPHNTYDITTPCTGCHGHEGSGPSHINGIFVGSGGTCSSCHDYDTGAGLWGSATTTLTGLTGTSIAYGSHKKHIEHLKVRTGVTLSAGNPLEFGSAAFNAVCGVCHIQDRAVGHGPDGGASTRQVNFNASSIHLFGSQLTPTYGFGTKSCASLDCHYKATPTW